VDECTEGLDDCADPQLQCRNTVGGYGCIPRCSADLLFDPQQGACVSKFKIHSHSHTLKQY
ncbi:hypothetical protein AVEN_220278-1, partial [Araneus ventricosus]